ncbi:DUF815 domain-containing protein [Acutalibacter sp. 1XD8-33]|uniref:DUF815 domain-containing protein n=1 Tax=Acutalibacter sp. 1XD8-33 TaxID=2320081 RepID=UPI000EA000F9|nr:DUF815 domain-containing protein [Acutalibacter sp. 1XD8-33]RKJ40072.1 DUF815 domain-containing protein [Acutalibacter sp. 1XD8-33]
MAKKLSKLALRLRSMTVFRNLLEDPVVSALIRCLERTSGGPERFVPAYGEFVSRLYQAGYISLTDYLRDLVFDSDNVYIRMMGVGRLPDKLLLDSTILDLDTLSDAAGLDAARLLEEANCNLALARFEGKKVNLTNEYGERAKEVGRYGYGIYSRNRMLCLDGKGRVVPVRSPDPIRLSQLIDYQREKDLILENTRALLSGKPAANILLTGDAGTGKSSTVKAVVNELWEEGLRILEVRKEQLHEIPGILEELTENPLKFIIFIDDLSFERDDDDFSALKGMLEGSVSAKSGNVAVYATSNRRHLVKERFSDREGDEVHRRDSMQEAASLAERFGLRITFQRPDKSTYLNIVRSLAEEAELDLPDEELCAGAERFALSRSSRSARAARQYVDGLIAKK